MALGIGVNTTVFSIAESVLLRPLPYRDSDRVVLIQSAGGEEPGQGLSLADFGRLRESAARIDLASYRDPGRLRTEAGGVRASWVGCRLFDVLGVPPIIGSTSDDGSECGGSDDPRAVLSYGFWQSQYAGDPSVVGRPSAVALGIPQPPDIVAVMPPGFFFPDTDVQVWLISDIGGRAVGRLAADTTVSEAQAELDTIGRGMDLADPMDDIRAMVLLPIREAVIGDYDRVLWMLIGAAALVLLLACTNAANLLLARGSARQNEIAVRAALGAPRSALLRQLLAESLTLSTMAGLVAVMLAGAGTRLVVGLGLVDVPRMENASLNWRVLVFAAILSVVAGVIAGLVPAFRASRAVQMAVLRQEASGVSPRGGMALQKTLVAGQVAIAVVLVVACGLLIRSSVALARVEWGFDTENVGVIEGVYSWARDPAAAARVAEALEAIPGIESAAAARNVPLTRGSFYIRDLVVRDSLPASSGVRALTSIVTPEYFRALGTPLRGREFTDSDDSEAPAVAVLSESLAARLFQDEDPIGKLVSRGTVSMDSEEFVALFQSAAISDGTRILPGVSDVDRYTLWPGGDLRVVGVAADLRMAGDLGESVTPTLYVAYRQAVPSGSPGGAFVRAIDPERGHLAAFVRSRLGPEGSMAFLDKFVIRAEEDVDQALQTVRRRLLDADPRAVFDTIAPLGDMVSRSIGGTGSNRMMLSLTAVYGVLALLLAATGVYGVMTHAVSRRTREVGIRMAMGARPVSILRMVFGQVLALTGLGLIFGLSIAWASTRILTAFLYGVSSTDWFTYGAASFVLAGVAVSAALVPALKASRVDPVDAIRHA
jgi:predicted permease